MSAAVEITSPIAEAIRRRMEKRGLTRKALSLKAGLAEGYVRDILAGKSKNPRSEHLALLATALNCPVTELIDPELAYGPLRENEVVEKPEERAWLAFFRVLSPERRRDIILQILDAQTPPKNT
jgi:transcriptional regulator with XRE-family HTH domain